jgi:imidazolonepropionase-like amidohydrolase
MNHLKSALLIVLLLVSTIGVAQDKPIEKILITNVQIFDGKEVITSNGAVRIEGNLITEVSKKPLEVTDGETEIDGQGKFLMPGLIDTHVHLAWNLSPAQTSFVAPEYLAALALVEARATLMRGFTSVRDTGGPARGVKMAIDQHLFDGPRIWYAGAAIGMTGGHSDMRPVDARPRQMGGEPWTDGERSGITVYADGVPEVLTAARMQMRRGASFLKMFTTGAVSGLYDPLDISEYSFDEIKAAADEAKRWNTYLAVHSYNDKGTQAALNAGAMSIEHATLITEETAKLIAEKGAFLSTQTGIYLEDAPADWSADQKAKQQAAKEGLDNLFKLAKKYKIKMSLGTDLVGDMKIKKQQSYELSNRLKWFTEKEILSQATANNAELLYMSGPRSPYQGTIGVIEEGAFADLLLIDGDPTKDLTLFHNPEKNLLMIMKDGRIAKNSLK